MSCFTSKKIGILYDAFMYRISINKDNNYADSEVSRALSAKSWQRAKCLSSNYQHPLRADKIHAVQIKQVVKHSEDMARCKIMHDSNILCVATLLTVVPKSIMPRPHQKHPICHCFIWKVSVYVRSPN